MPTLADYLLAGPGGTGGNFGTMSPGEEAVAVTPGSVLDAAARSAYRLGATPRDAMRTAVQPTGGMVSDVDMARALLSEADVGKRGLDVASTMVGSPGGVGGFGSGARMSTGKLYHVAEDYNGGDLLPLAHKYRAGNEGEAIEQFLERWPDAGPEMAGYHVNQVHLYRTEDEARNHAANFGGSVLEIDPTHLDVTVDPLEFDHPVARHIPASNIRKLE